MKSRTVSVCSSKAEQSVSTNMLDGSDHCICGSARELGTVEFQCSGCMKWYHSRCLSCTASTSKCMPFMVSYCLVCKSCNITEADSFTLKQSNFIQMCITTLANLTWTQGCNNPSKTMFSRDKDIIPYIDVNWEGLTTMPRRIKQTWHKTIHKTMVKETDFFRCEVLEDSFAPGIPDYLFGLHEQDLSKIGPVFDSSGKVIKSEGWTKSICNLPPVDRLNGGTPSNGDKLNGSTNAASIGKGGRGAKRKGVEPQSFANKKAKVDTTATKLSLFGFPMEYPFNRDNYRYYLTEKDVHAPNRQEFDEGNEFAGKPIPSYFYRVVLSPYCLLSAHDRAPQLKLQDDRLTVTGDKGYAVIRATHGVNSGSWYFEVDVLDQPDGTHVRLGWSQALGCIQAPVGYDKFSYSFRSRKGTRFHDSIGKHYANGGYGKGDVIGCLIVLPDATKQQVQLPNAYKDLPLVKFKSHCYFEEKDETQLALKLLKHLPKSQIVFFKNGKCQGVAFSDIYKGTYYPAISLYKSITVKTNFGPDFSYAPDIKEFQYKPMSERPRDSVVEQCVADSLFFIENEGRLRLENSS